MQWALWNHWELKCITVLEWHLASLDNNTTTLCLSERKQKAQSPQRKAMRFQPCHWQHQSGNHTQAQSPSPKAALSPCLLCIVVIVWCVVVEGWPPQRLAVKRPNLCPGLSSCPVAWRPFLAGSNTPIDRSGYRDTRAGRSSGAWENREPEVQTSVRAVHAAGDPVFLTSTSGLVFFILKLAGEFETARAELSFTISLREMCLVHFHYAI